MINNINTVYVAAMHKKADITDWLDSARGAVSNAYDSAVEKLGDGLYNTYELGRKASGPVGDVYDKATSALGNGMYAAYDAGRRGARAAADLYDRAAAGLAEPKNYIPGSTPFVSAPPKGNWFQRLMSRVGSGTREFLGNDLPIVGRRFGIYEQPKVKWSPDSPQAVAAKRNPNAWEQVKRTNDPNMLLNMGDWGARNYARLKNIAKYDPAYELARMTGVREEDIINHHMRKYEMPSYRAATGSANMRSNVPLTAEQQDRMYDLDAKYKLKSAPVPMTQQQREAAAAYLKSRRLAQEELSAGGKHTQALAGADIKNPFTREDSPELYDWLISASRR